MTGGLTLDFTSKERRKERKVVEDGVCSDH